MKHNVIKYGANVILYALKLGEVLPQLTREHFIIFARNGELPNANQYCGTENSLLTIQPYLIPMVLGLRINLKSPMYKFSTSDLFECIRKEVSVLDHSHIQYVKSKLIDIPFIVNSIFLVSDLDMEFPLGYKTDIEDTVDKTSVFKSIHIDFNKEHKELSAYSNNQMGVNDLTNLLTFTNNMNEYKIVVIETL